MAAARALMDIEGMDALAIATKAMTIAADACIYTNHNFVTESITNDEVVADSPSNWTNVMSGMYKHCILV